eukprot:781541-Pyramimonas_sp.AAC.1
MLGRVSRDGIGKCNIQTGIGYGSSKVEGSSPTNLVGRGRQVLPAAQRGVSCPVDHPYRVPFSSHL